MAKSTKGKKKVASSKRRAKKPVKVKNLPAKRLEDREVLGGAYSVSNPTQRTFGGVAPQGQMLNLGL